MYIAAVLLTTPIVEATENNHLVIGDEVIREVGVQKEVLEEELKDEEADKYSIENAKESSNKETKIDNEEITEIDYKIALKELNYYKEDYQDQDINMRNAVLRFQSNHNLTVDGSFGNNSYKALQKRLKDENFVFTDIIGTPPTESKWIAINKTKRILTLYEGEEVIKKYPIAQGKHHSYTPEGKFRIANKFINPRWGGAGIANPVAGGTSNNPLGYRWMGVSYKGGGSIGIHGNSSPTSIGTNVSLGCIRMINSDVEELFELVELNIPVWIGSHGKLQEWGVDNKSYVDEY